MLSCPDFPLISCVLASITFDIYIVMNKNSDPITFINIYIKSRFLWKYGESSYS